MSKYRPAFHKFRHIRGSIVALAQNPDPAPQSPETEPIGPVASSCFQKASNALRRPENASSNLFVARLLARSTARKNWKLHTKRMARMFATMPPQRALAPAEMSPVGQLVTHLNGVRATKTRQGNRNTLLAKTPYIPTAQSTSAANGRI